MELGHAALCRSHRSHSVTNRLASAHLALVALVGLAAMAAPAVGAPSLESFVLSAGGVSTGPIGGCTSFAPPAPVSAFFGGGLGLPLDGLTACQVAGGFDDVTALVGPLTASRPLSSSWSTNSFNGLANAQSNYGHLSASGHSAFAGSSSSLTVTGSQGFGRCNDAFTITSPSVTAGQSGTIRVHATVVGTLSTNSNGSARVELKYQLGSPIFSMFSAQVNNATEPPFLNSIGGVGLSGFVRVPGAMSGSGQVETSAHSFVFGTPFDFNLGLFASTIPGSSSIVDTDFEVVVSSIEVRGPQGQVLPDFAVSAASGATYGPAGVLAVDDASPDVSSDAMRLTVAPNPSATGTRLGFRLPERVSSTLGIYDAAGRLVRQLRDDPTGSAAEESVWWDGRDDRGARLPSGTYYARLRSPAGSRMVRVVLVQ